MKINIQLFAEGISNNSTAPSQQSNKHSEGPIPKSFNVELPGIIGNTWNGGFITTVGFKKIYAGTTIKKYNIAGQIRMNTPLAPLATRLTTTIKAFFVPNSRVWENAEKFSAQKRQGAAGETTALVEPSFPVSNMLNGSGIPADRGGR